MRRRSRLSAALSVSLALVAAACAGGPAGTRSASDADAPDPNGELITNAVTEPDTIDPQRAALVHEVEQVVTVFEGLMTLEPRTLRPIPAQAARDPEVSGDLRVWKFTLREGLKWSDGSALSAEDFARGFARACDPRTGAAYGFILATIVGCDDWARLDVKRETAAAHDAARAKLGIKVIDRLTLEFTHREPAPSFGAVASLWIGMPVKREALDRGEAWTMPETYIGNGPFVLKEHVKGTKLVYEPNPHYRLGPPKLRKWTRLMLADASAALAAYKANELDSLSLTASDVRAIEKDPSLKSQLLDLPYAASYFMAFNLTRPPFNDVNVRQAFAKAFDREDYCRNVVVICQPANAGFIPPGVPGHDAADTFQRFDPAAARALLEKASPEARSALATIKLTFSSTALARTRFEHQQAMYEKHLPGVRITLDPVEPSAFAGLFKGGAGPASPQLFSLFWIADVPDQQSWYSVVWGGAGSGIASKRTGHRDPELTKLIAQADTERDPGRRDELYRQAGRMLSQDAPAIWMYYGSTKRLVKPWVRGVTSSSIDAGLGQLKMHEIHVTRKST